MTENGETESHMVKEKHTMTTVLTFKDILQMGLQIVKMV